jgi:membrane protein YqaA with SNARE-associated domain
MDGDIAIWLAVIGLVVLLNVVPALMPPTWLLLTYFHLNHGLDVVPLALVGAPAATLGRALLALLSRRVGPRLLPARWRGNLESLAGLAGQFRTLSIGLLVAFVLGPIPSEVLFVAVGIAQAPLGPVLAIFLAGRLVGYVFWISTASTMTNSLADVLQPRMGSASAVISQLLAYGLLILAMRIDWSPLIRRLDRHPPPPDHGVAPGSRD